MSCSDARGDLGVPDQGDTNACSGHVCASLCAAGGVRGADPDAIYKQALAGREDDGVALSEAVNALTRHGVPLMDGTTARAPRLVRAPAAPSLLRGVLDSQRVVGAVLALTPRVEEFLTHPERDHFVLRDAGRSPSRADEGHAVLLTGYSDDVGGGAFAARSSWGSDWGWSGHFWVPYGELRFMEQFYTTARDGRLGWV